MTRQFEESFIGLDECALVVEEKVKGALPFGLVFR